MLFELGHPLFTVCYGIQASFTISRAQHVHTSCLHPPDTVMLSLRLDQQPDYVNAFRYPRCGGHGNAPLTGLVLQNHNRQPRPRSLWIQLRVRSKATVLQPSD